MKTQSFKDVILRGAKIIDPQSGLNDTADLRITDGVIAEIGDISETLKNDIVLKGMVVIPGLYDMHVHLREPGQEDKEDIESGCNAAAAGGFTGVACMPNTDPPVDRSSIVDFIRKRAAGFPVEVNPIAAVTRERKGEKLVEMYDLLQHGAVGFSDDGSPVVNSEIMRRALEYSKDLKAVIIQHSEDPFLFNGVMNESIMSTRLGLAGIPSMCEDIMAARDIRLTEFTGGKLHIAHISTKETVSLVRAAKEAGIPVTAEVTPHHLFLTDEAVAGYDTDTKMNPPLRSEEDRVALVNALLDGTIDCIATDHAPHAPEEKEVEYNFAPFGVVGLETALGLIMTKLLHTGVIDWDTLIDRMAIRPRRILSLEPVKIEKGAAANLTIIDPDAEWEVDHFNFKSKSRNTPFKGWKLKGRAWGIFNKGQLVIN